MPIKLSDILEHKNPNYPIVDATSLKGNTYPISELSETGSIPSEKRKEGMIVFVQDENEYYGFIGDVASEWEDSTKWKQISAETNVQADWNETTTTSDAFIQNKPTIPTVPVSYAPTDAEKNVQVDWDEEDEASDAFIQNKPNTFAPSTHNHDNTYLKLSGGTLTGNLTLNSANPEILFNGTSDLGVDMAIKATPEGLDFYEPEDLNKIHFQILDDMGVNSPFGLQVGGISVISSERVLKNVTGNISMFTNDSNYITSYTDNNVSIANLKTKLAGGFANNAVAIGDSDDTVTIPGNLVVTGTTTTNNVEIVSTSNGVVFEGNVADASEGTLLAGTLSADRTYTLPDRSGTVMITNEKHYPSLTGNSGEWFTLFQITDQMGPINCKMYTYAHDCVEFNVAEGYNNPSNGNNGSITIINSVQNPNGSYATTQAVRINNEGYVEVQLVWDSSPTDLTVDIGVIVEGYQAPTLYDTLKTTTETAPISDSVDVNKTGLLRSKSHLIIGGGYEDTSTNTIKLSSKEDSYINNSKNFGIGTTNPKEKLTIKGTDQYVATEQTSYPWGGTHTIGVKMGADEDAGLLDFRRWTGTNTIHGTALITQVNSDGGYGLDFRVDNKLTNTPATTSRMFLSTSGEVGIGTTNPGQKLEVEGNIRLSKSDDVGNGLEIGRDSSTLNSFIIQRENADLFIRTNNTDRIRIKSDGKVGIGTAEPDEKLHINSGRILIKDNSTPIITKRSTDHRSWVHHIANDSSYTFAPSTENGGNTWDWGNTFKIGVNGDGRFKGDVTANDFITTSDRRIKSNIQEIENGLDVIKQFTSYEYEKEGRQDAGFIAQEVAEAIPYAVFTDDKGMLSMSDRPVLAHMHKAILELEKRIKSIENKLN